MTGRERIEAFLAGSSFAVVGASGDRSKYGNKVLRCYMMHGRTVYPVNPNASSVEGLDCYPDLVSVPRPLHGVSIITPPAVTERIVEAGQLLDVDVLDHLIVGDHRFVSLKERRLGFR